MNSKWKIFSRAFREKYKRIDSVSLFVFLGLAACFLYLLSVTWFKWGDLRVDTFRDSLAALKILNGEVVYRDFFYPYGFAPLYFLAFLYKIFGVHTNVAVACGITITAAVSWFIYRICRLFLDKIISGLAVFTYFFVFAFGFYCYNGIFNFILPYSLASVIFSLLVLAALYFFLQYILKVQKKYLLLWALALSGAFLCRITMSIVVWLSFCLAGTLLIFKDKASRKPGVIIYLFIPLLVAVCGYAAFLFSLGAFSGFKESIIDHVFMAKSGSFVLRGIGLQGLAFNFKIILSTFLMHVVVLVIFGCSTYLISSFFLERSLFELYSQRVGSRPMEARFRLVVAVGLILIAGMFINNTTQYRCLPLILFLGLVFFLVKVLRSGEYKKNLALFCLFAVSLAMTVRILFKTTPINYGFYLMVPGIIAYYVFFFYIPAGYLRRYLKNFSEPLFFSLLVCFFIVLALGWWSVSSGLYGLKSFVFSNERGSIKSWDDITSRRCIAAIDYLKNNTGPEDKVIVIPHAGAISFFSQRTDPLRYYDVSPPTVAMKGEKALIVEFSSSGADYIVLIHRPTPEFGPTSFGVDYARDLNSWIINNYQLVKLIGPYPFTTPEFGVAIFKKK